MMQQHLGKLNMVQLDSFQEQAPVKFSQQIHLVVNEYYHQ